jgi:nitrogen regulatory protein P-II 2
VEAAIKKDMLELVLEAIEKSACSGNIGDGKIFVHNIEQVIRIRTGETGEEAL